MKNFSLIAIIAASTLILIGALHSMTQSQSVHHPRIESQDASNETIVHSGTIKGRVLNSEGEPVSKALVFAQRENFLKGLTPLANTDDQGKFVLANLKPGTYLIYASKEEEGYPSTISAFHTGGAITIPQVTVHEGQVTAEVDIYLAPKASKLVGRVLDSKTMKPKSAELTLRRTDNPNYYYITGVDQKGDFEILVPSVPITIEAITREYDMKYLGKVSLRQNERRRIDILLR